MAGYPAKIKSFTWAGNTPFLVTSGASEAICWPFDGKEGPLGRKPTCVASGGKQNATFVESLPQENAVFAGFQDGSVILSEIDETKKSGRESILLLVRRDGQPRFVVLPIEG